MRIVRVLTRLNLGGPVRQVLASDPILMQRGHTIRILAGMPEPGEGDLFEELQSRGLDVVRIPELSRGVSPARDLRAVRRIRREVESFDPDLLHTHASKAGALGRRAVRGRIRGHRLPRIHTFHGHVLEGYFGATVSRLMVALERRLAKTTDRIVAVSHSTADDLVRLGVVEEEKLVVIQPGIELDALLQIERRRSIDGARSVGELRRELGLGTDALLVGVVGRLAAVKRPVLAVDIFETLATRYPLLVLVFVGDGSERPALEARIRQLPEELRGRVHLLGARPAMPGLLEDLDVVLLVSRSEGMPVSLIEAAAAGLPVLATPVGGVPEIVIHERTGYLGATPADLAYGLQQLIDRPLERDSMGERARLRVASRHTASALAGRLESLYRAVLAENEPGVSK